MNKQSTRIYRQQKGLGKPNESITLQGKVDELMRLHNLKERFKNHRVVIKVGNPLTKQEILNDKINSYLK